MRSLPEKTLEHWLSLYVANRFPRSAVWWPTRGQDISVGDLAGSPGKVILMEVKTAEWEPGRARHKITIDIRQLRAYLGRGIPVYYVFPIPEWTGVLRDTTGWLGGRRRSDLAYRRSGDRWFGEWSYVTTAHALHTALGPSPRQKSATLFTHPGGPSSVYFLVPGLSLAWQWSDFWTRFAACGSPEMPSLIVAPEVGSAKANTTHVPREELASNLRSWAADYGDDDRYPTRFYLPAPDEGETY